MDRYEFQDAVIEAAKSTNAVKAIKRALIDGREHGDGTLTVDLRFKWIADGMGGLYSGQQEEAAAACYSYLIGWMDGAAEVPELLNALNAIQARIEGVWDHPALIEYGELHTDPTQDILRIVEKVSQV